MKATCCIGMSLVLTLSVLAGAGAHAATPPPPPPPPSAPAASPGTPAAAVESFQSALAAGDRDAALSWLDAQVIIFESGGAEMSRDEYASHHLDSDMKFVRATKTDVVDRQASSAGDVAWVLTRTRTTGTFRDRSVDVEGVETMVLRRDGDRWRIVHIHWSSHARKAE